jgi:hypothetical protein
VSTREQLSALDLTTRLIDGLAAKDFESIAVLLGDDARLRAIVPSRIREEEGREAVVERLRYWFEPRQNLALLETEAEDVDGRMRFRYRFRGFDSEDGWTVVEQTGFVDAAEGRIAAIDLVCSGDRPVPAPA